MRGRLLYLCVGGRDGSGSGAVAPAAQTGAVASAGATTPEPDPGVGGREEGLDLPGGQIGVKLLCVEGESVLEDGRIGWICPEGRSA